jgi:hypothetical protein
MLRAARQRSTKLVQEFEVPESWGALIEIDEDGEFFGRYRGRDTDKRWEPARQVFLFVDEHVAPCWMRWYSRLDQEMSQVTIGSYVAIYRSEDESFTTKGGEERTVYTFAVVSEPCSDPLPDEDQGADEVGF